MTHRAWVLIVSGYVAMAAGFIVLGFILAHEIRVIRSTQKQLATIAVHNAGAICLGLTAPGKEQEMAIIEAYLEGDGTIVAQFTPTCARVAERAARDIFNGGALPDDLQAQLNRAMR